MTNLGLNLDEHDAQGSSEGFFSARMPSYGCLPRKSPSWRRGRWLGHRTWNTLRPQTTPQEGTQIFNLDLNKGTEVRFWKFFRDSLPSGHVFVLVLQIDHGFHLEFWACSCLCWYSFKGNGFLRTRWLSWFFSDILWIRIEFMQSVKCRGVSFLPPVCIFITALGKTFQQKSGGTNKTNWHCSKHKSSRRI